MRAYTIFKIAYVLSFMLVLIGSLFKIQHWPNGSNILSAGLLFAIAYIFIGIQSVFSNPNIELAEKILWTVGFTCFITLTGLVYLIKKPAEKGYKNKIS